MTSAAGVGTRPEWSTERATEVVLAHVDLRGPVLPVLHALQEEFGYLDARAVPLVAQLLNLSRADVHGVATFYRDFARPPRPGARAGLPGRGLPVGRRARRSPRTPPGRSASASAAPPTTAPSRSTRCSASATARSDPRSRSATGCTAAWTPTASTARRDRAHAAGVTGPVTTSTSPRLLGPLRRRRRGGRRTRRARRVERGRTMTLVRNGSRGMLWLEPLVEVATDRGRDRVRPGRRRRRRTDCSTAGCSTAPSTRSRLGRTDDIDVAARRSTGSRSPGSASSTRSRADGLRAPTAAWPGCGAR